MSRPRLLSPILLIAALAALLIFAATAAAETKVGEATSPVNGALLAEADVLKATASYDSTAGTVMFDVTTREAPTANPKLTMVGGLFSLTGSCDQTSIKAAKAALYPVALVVAPYAKPLGSPEAVFFAAEKEKELSEPTAEPASKSVNGATTALAATNPKTAGKPYVCAAIEIQESGASEPVEFISFPIALPSLPPAQTTTPVASGPPVSKPAAAALSLARPKPLSTKAGKWTKVKLTVTNSGGTAAGPVAIKAKAPRGVIVKPGTTKLPALLPGQSWTVVLEVQLTANAKKRSTISLTGTLPGLAATSSVVVKSAD